MPSLLCAHVLESSASALDFTLRSKAGAVKLVNAFSQASEYRRANPNLLILARNVLDKDDRWRDYAHNPAAFYAAHVAPHLKHPANSDIDVWETCVNEDGPRKIDGTDLLDIQDMALRAGFEADIAGRISAAGFSPAVGHFAVGNPSGTRAEQLRAWRAYAPALRAAHKAGGYIGLHVYFDISGWELTLISLIDVLTELGLPLEILITECGLGNGSKGVDAGWYATRTMQFEQQLRRDFPRVKLATIYSFGGGSRGGWEHFNVDNWPEYLEPLIAYGASLAQRPTNQQVFNAIRDVTGRPVGAVMAYDAMSNALKARTQNPNSIYDGPPPEEWGPTPEEAKEIKRRLGL